MQSIDSRAKTSEVKRDLEKAREHARSDIQKLDDVQARALMETSAEVLSGLITAIEHYEQDSETAWR